MIWSPLRVAVVTSTLLGTQPEICRSLCRSRSTSTTTSTCAHDLPEMVVRSMTRITLRPRVARASFCAVASGETYISTSLMMAPCSFCCAHAVARASDAHSSSAVRITLDILTSLQHRTIDGNFLFELIDQIRGAGLPLALGKLIVDFLR